MVCCWEPRKPLSDNIPVPVLSTDLRTLLLYEGNEDLREMTKHRRYLLRIDFSPDGEFYTEYDNFTIGSESDHYPLHANYVAPDGNRKDAGQ